MTTTAPEYTAQDDEYYSPIEVAEGGVRCGNHPSEWKVRHENVAAVRACYAIGEQMAAQQRGEMYAEAAMSWVCGGGNPLDASRYAGAVANGREWDGGIGDVQFSGKTCDHGLALELCADPINHYPPDSYFD
jgi:hypothetical protein